LFQRKFVNCYVIGIFFFISAATFAYCGANAEQQIPRNELANQSSLPSEPEPLLPETEVIEQTEPIPVVPSRAEEVMKAISAAYAPRISGPAVFQNGDWTVTIRGELFYYAEGRILPEDLKDNYAEYDGQPFYRYIKELPPWEPASE
jgi:hypothetical protein